MSVTLGRAAVAAHPPWAPPLLARGDDLKYAARVTPRSAWLLTIRSMLSRRVLPGACRVLPVLIAAVGTLEYLAADFPHLGRSLAFVYLASAVLLLNQRHPFASPLAG